MTTQIDSAVRHIFDETVQVTHVIEYGISWSDLLTGKVNPPAEGARFDIYFEGSVRGETVKGKIKGVDFLEVRADGRCMLNIQATIITEDGETIALHEGGVMTLWGINKPADLHLNMKFSTHSDKYGWLNTVNVWGIGKVNNAQGMATVSAFAATAIPVLNYNPN